ncbi:protein kinase domain-containing protein [Nesterenkonia populi]
MSEESSWIGSTIDGRYRIQDRIARGGMSTVYRARDERLNRDVAVKVLFPHMAEDRKVVTRFENEARNSARLAHPNVVQVLDQGQTRETAYMVMEYVPGVTLRTLLKKGPMTPRLALAYTEAVLGGLSAAHRAGLVHRDIKPENVLVSTEGRIKLADFGLARAATHHSGTSTLMGTVAYIAPELLSGEGADERADIYALGILLYEMLTGGQPYTGDSPVRVAFQHVNSTVPAPSSSVPGLAAQLDELVRAATQADPGERPKHADEMLEMVEAAKDSLSEEQLDFRGAQQGHARRRPEAEEAAPATAAMPSMEEPGDDAPDDDDAGPPPPGDDDRTQLMSSVEDFPTTVEPSSWDEDVTTALGTAKSAPPRPRASSTLGEEERQTVAEVPLPGRLGISDDDTGVHSAARSRPGSGTQGRVQVGSTKKDRQRPAAQLAAPTPARQGIAVAVLMIVLAVVMLIAYQLGISPSIIPSLGGGGE